MKKARFLRNPTENTSVRKESGSCLHGGAAKDKRARRNRTPRDHAAPSRLSNAQHLKALQEWLLPEEGIFASLALHGNTKWRPAGLIWLALCWGWAESKNVTDAFETALGQCRLLGTDAPEHLSGIHGSALVRWTDRLMACSWPLLHALHGPDRRKVLAESATGFPSPSMDRAARRRARRRTRRRCVPRTTEHGKTAKYRKKKTKGMRRRKNEKNKPQPQKPQAWITLLWHMGLRLPWMWRLGPSNSSERTHVKEMLAGGRFPEKHAVLRRCRLHRLSALGTNSLRRLPLPGPRRCQREPADGSDRLDESQKDGLVLCWPKAARQLRPATPCACGW